MNPSQPVSAPWVFRDTEYTVSADVRDDVLLLEVEEKLTADQWSSQFEAKREGGGGGSGLWRITVWEYSYTIACRLALNGILEVGQRHTHLVKFFSTDIEELTRKTGNFKQFPIFLNMLESAITKVTI